MSMVDEGNKMSREFTSRMIELLEEGLFNKDDLIVDLLNFLSEDEVKCFVKRQDFYGFEHLGFKSSWYDYDEDFLERDDDNALEEEFN